MRKENVKYVKYEKKIKKTLLTWKILNDRISLTHARLLDKLLDQRD